MNKIVMSTEKSLSGVIENLIISSSHNFIIKNDVYVKKITFQNQNFKVNFCIEENASFTFGNVIVLENVQGTIVFTSKNHTALKFNLGIHSIGNNELTIQNIIIGNYNQSEIKIRIIGDEDSKIVLKSEGILKEKTKENAFLEDIGYLNDYPGSVVCLPELKVATNEVIANHNMTVGNISEETLFYLKSRGLDEIKAKKMLRESFVNCMIREEGIK